MDAAVTGAITPIHFDNSDHLERWFDLICRAYDRHVGSGPADWTAFTALLAEDAEAEGIAAAQVEQFVEYLDRNDPAPMETVGQLRELADTLRLLPAVAAFEQYAVRIAGTTDETAAGVENGRHNRWQSNSMSN